MCHNEEVRAELGVFREATRRFSEQQGHLLGKGSCPPLATLLQPFSVHRKGLWLLAQWLTGSSSGDFIPVEFLANAARCPLVCAAKPDFLNLLVLHRVFNINKSPILKNMWWLLLCICPVLVGNGPLMLRASSFAVPEHMRQGTRASLRSEALNKDGRALHWSPLHKPSICL